jgi:hypothetical protein
MAAVRAMFLGSVQVLPPEKSELLPPSEHGGVELLARVLGWYPAEVCRTATARRTALDGLKRPVKSVPSGLCGHFLHSEFEPSFLIRRQRLTEA